MIGNSGPMRVTPNGVLDEVEALSAAESKMLFALDHWNQPRGQDSTFAGPARTTAAGSAPAMTNVAREDTKEVPNTETSAEEQHDKASLFCSGEVMNKSEEAQHKLSTVDAVPRETGAAFETADFARPSLTRGECSMHRHDPLSL